MSKLYVNTPLPPIFTPKSHGLYKILVKALPKYLKHTILTVKHTILPSLLLSNQTSCMSGQTLSLACHMRGLHLKKGLH